MVQAELEDWRRNVHDFLHETRVELRQIIAAVDDLLSPASEAPDSAPSSSAQRLSSSAVISSAARFTPAAPASLEPISKEITDLSQRLSHLKQQLNQRLQTRDNSSVIAAPTDPT